MTGLGPAGPVSTQPVMELSHISQVRFKPSPAPKSTKDTKGRQEKKHQEKLCLLRRQDHQNPSCSFVPFVDNPSCSFVPFVDYPSCDFVFLRAPSWIILRSFVCLRAPWWIILYAPSCPWWTTLKLVRISFRGPRLHKAQDPGPPGRPSRPGTPGYWSGLPGHRARHREP